jgi:Arc/MetJ-type ribon-helix-helix transcriptional regulator
MRRQLLKIELTADAASWVSAEVAAGTFSSPEDAVRFAINQAKLLALRHRLEDAEAEGGNNSAEDVLNYVKQQLDSRSRSKVS